VLVVGLVAYSLYANPNSQLEVQAKITEFTADTSFKGALVVLTNDIWFNITVQNKGKTDITGANITVTI
jgi:hypothetical protein